jgi:thiol-disulfide isomerase/thioredoxin
MTKAKFEEMEAETDLSELVKEGKTVIVDFKTTHCGWCKEMGKVLKELGKDGTLDDCLVLGVDLSEFPRMASKFKELRTGVPVLIAFHNGKKVGVQDGFCEADELAGKVRGWKGGS